MDCIYLLILMYLSVKCERSINTYVSGTVQCGLVGFVFCCFMILESDLRCRDHYILIKYVAPKYSLNPRFIFK